MPLVLIISPDATARAPVRSHLAAQGFDVAELEQADGAAAILPFAPDLLVVDWVSSTQNMLEFCRRLRGNPITGTLPILMMTARGGEEDRILALEAGVDDLLLKPFLPPELSIRVKNLLRYSAGSASSRVLLFDQFILDKVTRRLYRDGQEVRLDNVEFRLLELFIRAPNKVHSRVELRDLIWHAGQKAADQRTIDVYIMRLRKLLAVSGRRDVLRTVRGIGYTLVPAGTSGVAMASRERALRP